MSFQKINLETLYEHSQTQYTDYLLKERVDGFDWSNFWKFYIFCEQNYSCLYESFELKNKTETTDQYKVVATNGSEFEVYVNFIKPYQLDNKILNALYSDPKNKPIIRKLKNCLAQTKSPVLNVNFRDSDKNIHLTGKLGNYSFSVISGIKKSIIDSIHARNDVVPDIIYFLANKNEQKKIDFFVNGFSNMFGLHNTYVDSSHPQYSSVFLFR